ncbi:MAG TPA: hypothetical protein VKD23_02270 [Terriglobales bacterium]|jgi:hypothetical protein|nr:hypothetical protein [Terriglobales bacterium]
MNEVEEMFVGFPAMLNSDDDPEVWKAAISVLLDEFRFRHQNIEKGTECFLRIGACSHWFRPHQARWTAAGGFAWPTGYLGGKGFMMHGLPEFDWSVIFQLAEGKWRPAAKFSGKRKLIVRVAIPSRTARHKQAAVHTLWQPANQAIFYGFRKLGNGWKCVANSEELVAAARDRRLRPKPGRSKRQ